MADEAPQQDPQPEQPEREEPRERTIPYDRFQEVNKRAKEMEREVAELREWREQQEAANLSAQEREQKARERAERKAVEAEQKLQRLERSSYVRSVAQRLEFQDPDDAVALVDLGAADDERSAERLVRDLAKRKPHLLRPKQPGPPQIGQVLENGSPVQGQNAQQTEDPRDMLGQGLLEALQRFGRA